MNQVDYSGNIIHSDTSTWTVHDPIELLAWDPNDFYPFSAAHAFVPADSPGWTITFPGRDVTPAQRCEP